MKTKPTILAVGIVLTALANGFGATRYVNVNSASPTPPYTNWASAATTIQDAVDAAVAGDEIVVTNGVYQTGGRAVSGTMTNRVAVTKPLTVRSVNGPEVTVIRGYQVPGTTNGDSAVRCVYLTNGAALVGFTLTKGTTRAVYDYPTNRESSGGGVWCESASAVVSNCVLSGNSAYRAGGGAYAGTLNNCTLTGNSAYEGGGAVGGTLNNCTVFGNCASGGGGAYNGTLNHCTLTGNSAQYGGGAYACTLNNCTLNGNSAYRWGGGAIETTLNNCTLTGNSASEDGGGAYGGTLKNCIVYYNTAVQEGANYGSLSTLNYCCTTPLPPSGVGNLAAEPQLASVSHLSAGSPCRGAGSPAYSNGVDIDGELWANPPAIGCDEPYPGTEIGPLTLAIQASLTNVAIGFEVNFTAQINGILSVSRWEFGDGTAVSNQPYAMHDWYGAGDYPVVLRAYNQSYPGGVSATVTVHVVSQPVYYVAPGSGTPVAPYSSWATAATNIQDAVDAVAVAGALARLSLLAGR